MGPIGCAYPNKFGCVKPLMTLLRTLINIE